MHNSVTSGSLPTNFRSISTAVLAIGSVEVCMCRPPQEISTCMWWLGTNRRKPSTDCLHPWGFVFPGYWDGIDDHSWLRTYFHPPSKACTEFYLYLSDCNEKIEHTLRALGTEHCQFLFGSIIIFSWCINTFSLRCWKVESNWSLIYSNPQCIDGTSKNNIWLSDSSLYALFVIDRKSNFCVLQRRWRHAVLAWD